MSRFLYDLQLKNRVWLASGSSDILGSLVIKMLIYTLSPWPLRMKVRALGRLINSPGISRAQQGQVLNFKKVLNTEEELKVVSKYGIFFVSNKVLLQRGQYKYLGKLYLLQTNYPTMHSTGTLLQSKGDHLDRVY
jgi:hypothetical protein